MRHLLTFIAALLLSSSGVLADIDNFEDIINEHGYDPATVNDLSDSAKIKLAEPRCAYVNISGIYLMPTLKTENLKGWLEYYDENGNYFKKRVILNAQGNSTIRLPKKNVSVKFYEEAWGEGPTPDISFGNWVKQDAFHLKAFYTDYLRGCGKIAYDIYDDIVSDREMPFPWQRAGVTTASKKAMCHPNGFPCYVYVGGWFYGLYTWSLKKHHKNMGQEKDNPQHIHLDGLLADETVFKDKIEWSLFEVRTPKNLYSNEVDERTLSYIPYDRDSPMELIDSTMQYYDPENEGHVLTNKVKQHIVKLNSYYTELKALDATNPAPETFKQKYSQFFDTQGLTDYIVHSLVTNNYDGHWKNWQWITYDGNKWYVEPYDLDCTFGHHASGVIILPPEWNNYVGTHFYEFFINAGIQRLFLKYYFDEIKDRYTELREKQLIDPERYVSYVRDWADRIGTAGFELEHEIWYKSPCLRETTTNPNWTTEDNWENFNSYPVFSEEETYNAGDKCWLNYRIWTATGTTQGVRPYKQMGAIDSQKRVEEWIRERISLLDNYFNFDTDPIQELTSDGCTNTRKVIQDRHLYIIKDGKTYSFDGRRMR